ncbi:hypothetical protein O181_014803 [Austropuccinia psidii MF-1]|uniref:Secreted protein n=1 Tax=Austropuccinia psidii MF-1 TaxID=1389203 RepID=A0A9Q3GPD1_9BASI|nr:hypothetical protein [Austropuccinia psidii MF-1]
MRSLSLVLATVCLLVPGLIAHEASESTTKVGAESAHEDTTKAANNSDHHGSQASHDSSTEPFTCKMYSDANTTHANIVCKKGCTGGVVINNCTLVGNKGETPSQQTCTITYGKNVGRETTCQNEKGVYSCFGQPTGNATCSGCEKVNGTDSASNSTGLTPSSNASATSPPTSPASTSSAAAKAGTTSTSASASMFAVSSHQLLCACLLGLVLSVL